MWHFLVGKCNYTILALFFSVVYTLCWIDRITNNFLRATLIIGRIVDGLLRVIDFEGNFDRSDLIGRSS